MIHINSSGEEMELAELHDSHLLNAIKRLQGDIAQYEKDNRTGLSWSAPSWRTQLRKAADIVLANLEAEVERRGLNKVEEYTFTEIRANKEGSMYRSASDNTFFYECSTRFGQLVVVHTGGPAPKELLDEVVTREVRKHAAEKR